MRYSSCIFSIPILLAAWSEGFLAKKQQNRKEVFDDIPPRSRRADSSEDDSTNIVRAFDDDPHSKLAAWIKVNARQHIPLKYPKKMLDVYVSAGLYQIVDLDQKNNLATVSAYLEVFWFDEFLKYNTSDYGGISKIFVPLKYTWRPEFYMYHSVHGRVPDYPPDASCEVRSDGRIRMFVSIASKSFCPINFKRFPFDKQKCTFSCGSWTYQSDVVNYIVHRREIILEDFFDNQEWLLESAFLYNDTTRNLTHNNETYSMVVMELELSRQSFYYVFNLVFPTTLVSLVAVIGFHAPINATGRRESKFRLGIMTLLSMSVMLLMLVGEMKFAMKSVQGKRGSFSDLPLMGIYYMSLIFMISIATCSTSIFVHLEKYALRNPSWESVPWFLRWLAAKKLFCCYVPPSFRLNKDVVRNNNVQAISLNSSPDRTVMRNLIPKEINFTEVNQDAPLHDDSTILEANGNSLNQIQVIISLMREIISMKNQAANHHHLRSYWERIIKRLENLSLTFYLSLIVINLLMFLFPEPWY